MSRENKTQKSHISVYHILLLHSVCKQTVNKTFTHFRNTKYFSSPQTTTNPLKLWVFKQIKVEIIINYIYYKRQASLKKVFKVQLKLLVCGKCVVQINLGSCTSLIWHKFKCVYFAHVLHG